MSYGPNNSPPDTCSVCDRPIIIDEPPQCHYTGRHCDSGCDCGETYSTKCRRCGGRYEPVDRRFPQDLDDDALDRCINACEAGGGPKNYEDWAYLEMLKDEREDRKEEGVWRWTDEASAASSGDSAR